MSVSFTLSAFLSTFLVSFSYHITFHSFRLHFNTAVTWKNSSLERKNGYGINPSGRCSLPHPLPDNRTPHQSKSHLPPLAPSTWKKPMMTKGLDVTNSITCWVSLNKNAFWLICLLNQTTKAVDSTTPGERDSSMDPIAVFS